MRKQQFRNTLFRANPGIFVLVSSVVGSHLGTNNHPTFGNHAATVGRSATEIHGAGRPGSQFVGARTQKSAKESMGVIRLMFPLCIFFLHSGYYSIENNKT